MSKKMFHRDCYVNTGWLPMHPLVRGLAVGDVCQLRQGRLQPRLNVVDAGLVERLKVSRPIPLDPVDWGFGQGVQQSLCETRWSVDGDGERRASTRQVLEFARAGAFMFHAGAAHARLLTNWNEIRDDVTLKLTQLHYGFRDVYVVSGIVTADDWALACAAQAGARLEMTTALDSCDRYSLFSHRSASSEQCHGIAALERSDGRPAHFFKAKKLVLSDATHDHYLGQLLDGAAAGRTPDLSNWLAAPLLDLVKTNELNLNTSIGFFSWVDLTLDDVERLAG